MRRAPLPPGIYRQRVPALAPYAEAVTALAAGRTDTELRLRSSLGEDEVFPLDFFLRTPDEMMPFELYALELCHGRVLDLGAGAGPHTLALQAAGHSVLAVEISPALVILQRRRGVRAAICADFRLWSAPGFDTVIMLMNGLGPTGTLAGLDRFLRHAHAFLAPAGQLVVDAAEALPERTPTIEPWPPAGAYDGQAWIELSFEGRVGMPFRELYIDIETLARHARAAGWRFEIAFESEEGGYLARLTQE